MFRLMPPDNETPESAPEGRDLIIVGATFSSASTLAANVARLPTLPTSNEGRPCPIAQLSTTSDSSPR